MRSFIFAFAMFATVATNAQDSLFISKIFENTLTSGHCYENLRVLCKDIGPRLSGSPAAEKAIQWGESTLRSYDPDSVYLQEVTVPHWVRGNTEKAILTSEEKKSSLAICALGGSIGTNGILEANIIEVKKLEELSELGEEHVKGKIVFFNRPLDPVLINTGMAYGGANDQRSYGAAEAAKYGAVGVLVRSLTHALDQKPHTGSMYYLEEGRKIPAAAISTVDANNLHNAMKSDPSLRVSLELDCELMPDVIQHNVIAEFRGTDTPKEYIVVGGHLDSWDIGEGAHDDGSGIVHSIEVLKNLKDLNYQPKHTIRVVLFINEENGNNGGKTYANIAKAKKEKHIAALESDMGGFVPRGFSMEATDQQTTLIRSWGYLFEPYNVHTFRRGWSGVDIRPLKNGHTALIGLVPDNQRYFDFHHSANDTFENVHKRELELGAATMTALIYLLDQHL